jgi:hypothetical protein
LKPCLISKRLSKWKPSGLAYNFMAGNSNIARRDLLEAKRVHRVNGMAHNSIELQRVNELLHKIKGTGAYNDEC